MPIPREFEEELVFEWLLLKGYSAEVNVDLGIDEADVIGYRIKENGTLEILHIEVGTIRQSFDEELRSIEKKFSEDRKRKVIRTILNKHSLGEIRINYIPMYIVTTPIKNEDKWKQELGKKGIRFMTIYKFIKEEVFKAIKEWKTMKEKLGFVKNWEWATLPRSFWLMNLVERVKDALSH